MQCYYNQKQPLTQLVRRKNISVVLQNIFLSWYETKLLLILLILSNSIATFVIFIATIWICPNCNQWYATEYPLPNVYLGILCTLSYGADDSKSWMTLLIYLCKDFVEKINDLGLLTIVNHVLAILKETVEWIHIEPQNDTNYQSHSWCEWRHKCKCVFVKGSSIVLQKKERKTKTHNS